MSELLQIAGAFFERQRWNWKVVEQPSALEVSWANSRFAWKSYAQSKGEGTIFVYYSLVPEAAPEASRGAVATFLSQVNYDQLVGGWEMHMDSGETRFRSAVDLRGEALSEPLLLGVVQASHQAMLSYLPGLLRVMRGEQSARDAYRDAAQG